MTVSDARGRLLDRRDERRALDDLLVSSRAGRSAALVLRGEAGIGKTELLKYLVDRSGGLRILRAAGVQSEMELSYAGLHQLCGPLLANLDHLPEPQRAALASAFGLRAGDPPDPFLVGLATLSLLAEAGASQPLVCLIDDGQWLDQASARTLSFVARRLLAESVVLVFAVREPTSSPVLAGLPELVVTGLPASDSRTLLDSIAHGPRDRRMRDRILAEARGNPLAIIELPRGWTEVEMAGGFAGSEAAPLSSRLEQGFRRRLELLPAATRLLLLTAAAEPVGDVALLRRAAGRLGIDVDAAASYGDAAELLTLDTRVRFRHPLVRSAVYRGASVDDRQRAHRALADSIDTDVDPDRRAWHRAQAASSVDEEVASELERSAERAQSRGGTSAAAAFLERATELTPDPARRSMRALRAAQAKLQAGAFEPAAALLAMAGAGPADELMHARIDQLRAILAFAQNRGNDATPLLVAAARRLEPIDLPLARETYLDAIAAATFTGRLARGQGLREVGEAALAAPPVDPPRLADSVLDALALNLTDGYAVAAPKMQRVLAAVTEELDLFQEAPPWFWLATVLAVDLWDDERWRLTASRHVVITRESGVLSELPAALDARACAHLLAGELAAASALIGEVTMVYDVIGGNSARVMPLALAAFRGREQESRTLIDDIMNDAVPRGQGAAVTVAQWARAVLCNGLGQYDEAMTAARLAAGHEEEPGTTWWASVELVEAAARCGDTALAVETLGRLSDRTRASGTDWGLGVEARSRALLSQGEVAESLFLEAIERLSRTEVRMEMARAHLVYGEWLRSEDRDVDARAQLRTADEMLTQFGAEAFAERARRALQATGATLRKKVISVPAALTPQEEQIARLAGEGLTNPEIGARLYLSRHTVEWHLRKVFTKLSIASRREISSVLPPLPGERASSS